MAQIRKEEYLKIRKAARIVTEQVIKPTADISDRQAKPHKEGIEKLAELGLLGIYIPPTLGGHPADARSFAAVIEEISRACPSTALLVATHVAACATLAKFADERQQSNWFSQLSSGEWLCGFAGRESDLMLPPNDPADCVAKKEKGEYVINGERRFVSGAHFFNAFLVLTRVEEKSGMESDAVFFVQGDDEGFIRAETDDRLGLRAMASGTLKFRNLRVGEEKMAGRVGDGIRMGREFKSHALLGAAAAALGISLEMVHIASDYVRDMLNRRGPQFGRQRATRYLANMAVWVQAMRLMVEDAAYRSDIGEAIGELPLQAYMAKAFNAEMAVKVGDSALKLIGTHGYSRQYALERLFRDLRGLMLQYVGTDALLEAIGETELDSPFISQYEL
ncbi:MAG: acyl-CoA dehydrogenase [Myxococcota bacterium]